MLLAGDTTQPNVLLDALAHSAPQYEEVVMTIEERLREEARQKGIQEGIEKGAQKGRQEGRQEVARAMLMNGIDRIVVMQCTGLSEQELDQLNH